ncbi:MAG: pseudouridine synthase [Clostridia bacterium]
MRLQKYLALCGVASRRKAEEMIAAGKINVNGQAVTRPGTLVRDGDKVDVQGREVRPESKKDYILFHKPEMVITSAKDQFKRKTVMDFVKVSERIYPVGRLDYGTSGLLILTNDGDFAKLLTHPSHEVKKTYKALVKGTFDEQKKKRLETGVDIGGHVTFPAEIRYVPLGGQTYEIEIVIREGKNHQVKKMLETVGCRVARLERTAIGEIRDPDLQKGKWRRLTRKELQQLGYLQDI